MLSKQVKLNRLARIKARRIGSTNYSDHIVMLYWRYWFQVYKKHEPLWDIINEGVVWKKGKGRG